MPDLKERPTMDKPKHKAPALLSPKQAARVVASKYQRQFEQRIPGEESETEYATGRTEGAASGTVAELTKHVHGLTTQNRANKIKERPHQPEAPPTGESTSTGTDAPPTAQSTSKEHAPPRWWREPHRSFNRARADPRPASCCRSKEQSGTNTRPNYLEQQTAGRPRRVSLVRG